MSDGAVESSALPSQSCTENKPALNKARGHTHTHTRGTQRWPHLRRILTRTTHTQLTDLANALNVPPAYEGPGHSEQKLQWSIHRMLTKQAHSGCPQPVRGSTKFIDWSPYAGGKACGKGKSVRKEKSVGPKPASAIREGALPSAQLFRGGEHGPPRDRIPADQCGLLTRGASGLSASGPAPRRKMRTVITRACPQCYTDEGRKGFSEWWADAKQVLLLKIHPYMLLYMLVWRQTFFLPYAWTLFKFNTPRMAPSTDVWHSCLLWHKIHYSFFCCSVLPESILFEPFAFNHAMYINILRFSLTIVKYLFYIFLTFILFTLFLSRDFRLLFRI